MAAGRKLARDTAIVNGSGGEFAALRNGYAMAQRMVTVAERQHAVGGVTLQMVVGHTRWRRADRGGLVPARGARHGLDGQAGRVRARRATLRDRHRRQPVGRRGGDRQRLERHRRRCRPLARRRTERLADPGHGRAPDDGSDGSPSAGTPRPPTSPTRPASPGSTSPSPAPSGSSPSTRRHRPRTSTCTPGPVSRARSPGADRPSRHRSTR